MTPYFLYLTHRLLTMYLYIEIPTITRVHTPIFVHFLYQTVPIYIIYTRCGTKNSFAILFHRVHIRFSNQRLWQVYNMRHTPRFVIPALVGFPSVSLRSLRSLVLLGAGVACALWRITTLHVFIYNYLLIYIFYYYLITFLFKFIKILHKFVLNFDFKFYINGFYGVNGGIKWWIMVLGGWWSR